MLILIAGATGKTGTRLVHELDSRGHRPIALVRRGSDTSSLPAHIGKREGDLTDLPQNIAAGCDVVVFAAGSGGGTSDEMTNEVDRDGAIKLVDMSIKSGVRRFVMLSSIGADDPGTEGDMGHYLRAKHDAEQHLKSTQIEFAILRPVALTDQDGCGDIRLGDDVDPEGKAARGDVARVLADAAEQPAWAGRISAMESRTCG